MNEIDLEAGLDDLALQFGNAQGFSVSFRAELERVQTALRGTERESSSLSRSMGSNLRSAFEGLVFDGEKLSDVLRGVGRSLANSVFSSAIKPVQDAFSQGAQSIFGGLFSGVSLFGDGAALSAGKVRAFASGGVVDGPSLFPMAGGMGLMGEAGPEAIMPLSRGADGKLGVRGSGGQVNVTMHITTPDAEGFRRSNSQIAASLSRAIRSGQRNL